MFFSKKKKLPSLGLFSDEITSLIEQLIGIEKWHTHGDEEHLVRTHILKLKKGKYFAIVDCESLCGIDNKVFYIQQCVETAMKKRNLTLSYDDIAVGGLASDEGRLAIFSTLFGEPPPAVHEYCLFKLPGESHVVIEDPRTGVFEEKVKFQSRFNDEICCFASAALFYAGFTMYKKDGSLRSTQDLHNHLYDNIHLKFLSRSLEKKVGHSTETKEEVTASYIDALKRISRDPEQLNHTIQKNNITNCRK